MTKGDVFRPCVRGNLQGFKKTFVILGLVLVSGVLNARANLYYDYDYINTVLSSVNRDNNGTFNIAVQGYDPSAESMSWAGFAFTFIDSDNQEDTVRISLSHEAVTYEHIEYGFNIFGGLLAGDALLDLSADGIISYNVRWISGDPFKLVSATLLAETTANAPPPAPVPDGGLTLAMLGLALLALGWAQKKLKPSRNN
jgi:hypothetical protein